MEPPVLTPQHALAPVVIVTFERGNLDFIIGPEIAVLTVATSGFGGAI